MMSLAKPRKAKNPEKVEMVKTLFFFPPSLQGQGLDLCFCTWPAGNLFQTDVFIGVTPPLIDSSSPIQTEITFHRASLMYFASLSPISVQLGSSLSLWQWLSQCIVTFSHSALTWKLLNRQESFDGLDEVIVKTVEQACCREALRWWTYHLVTAGDSHYKWWRDNIGWRAPVYRTMKGLFWCTMHALAPQGSPTLNFQRPRHLVLLWYYKQMPCCMSSGWSPVWIYEEWKQQMLDSEGRAVWLTAWMGCMCVCACVCGAHVTSYFLGLSLCPLFLLLFFGSELNSPPSSQM